MQSFLLQQEVPMTPFDALQLHMESLLRVWADRVAIRDHISTEAWHSFKCNCLDQVATIIAQYSQQRRSPLDGLPASRVLLDQLGKLVDSGILTHEEKTLALKQYMQEMPLTLPLPAGPVSFVQQPTQHSPTGPVSAQHTSAIHHTLSQHGYTHYQLQQAVAVFSTACVSPLAHLTITAPTPTKGSEIITACIQPLQTQNGIPSVLSLSTLIKLEMCLPPPPPSITPPYQPTAMHHLQPPPHQLPSQLPLQQAGFPGSNLPQQSNASATSRLPSVEDSLPFWMRGRPSPTQPLAHVTFPTVPVQLSPYTPLSAGNTTLPLAQQAYMPMQMPLPNPHTSPSPFPPPPQLPAFSQTSPSYVGPSQAHSLPATHVGHPPTQQVFPVQTMHAPAQQTGQQAEVHPTQQVTSQTFQQHSTVAQQPSIIAAPHSNAPSTSHGSGVARKVATVPEAAEATVTPAPTAAAASSSPAVAATAPSKAWLKSTTPTVAPEPMGQDWSFPPESADPPRKTEHAKGTPAPRGSGATAAAGAPGAVAAAGAAGGNVCDEDGSFPTKTIIVRNISRTISQSEMEAAFAHLGEITTVRIAKSRIPEDNIMNAGLRNAGYCFIEFKKLNSAVQAVCSMDGTSLHCEETGRPRTMHIRYAIDKESAAKGVVAKAADGASRKSSRNSSKSVQQDGWTEVADKRW